MLTMNLKQNDVVQKGVLPYAPTNRASVGAYGNTPSNQRQRGMSLVEIMIAMAIGMFLLLGLTTFLSTTLHSNASTVKLSSLNQELRTIMTLMTRDIRRTGYWGSTSFTTGALSEIGAGSAVYAASVGSTFAYSLNTATAGCILYSYDINTNGALDAASERYGFMLNNNAVLMSLGGATTCAVSSAWDNLSDTKNTHITVLTFTPTETTTCLNTGLACVRGAAGTPNITTRTIAITLTGQPLNGAGQPDTSITQTLTETVKIENDLFSPT